MINIGISSKDFFDIEAEGYVYILEKGFTFSKQLQKCADRFFPDLKTLMQKRNFTGKKLEMLILPVVLHGKIAHCFFAGIGAKEDQEITLEHYRRVLGSIIKQAASYKIKTLAIQMPSSSFFGLALEDFAQQTTTILHMASYYFDDYITDQKRKKRELSEVILSVETKNKKKVQKGIKTGEIIGQSVNEARHWVDLPPTVLDPKHFVEKTKKLAKNYNLSITVFSKDQISAMGMGGLIAVSRGSEIGPRLIVLEYHAKKKSAPLLALVGKGVTFDSGGLSLKTPAVHMETMKEDMAGAAAVVATMQALAQLKPSVHVVAVVPLAENLPDSKSIKPGDIIQFYNKKTAEIKNTDAEGRLILADALSYAVKQYNPDAIIDIATLTGACAYALGPYHSGLLSEHDNLVKRIYKAAAFCGDKVWRLPMGEDYKRAIHSHVADICNIGSRKVMAGATTAAHFLQHFVGDTPWAHLDIAGTAFNVPDVSYYEQGATGAGVRLLVELAMTWQ